MTFLPRDTYTISFCRKRSDWFIGQTFQPVSQLDCFILAVTGNCYTQYGIKIYTQIPAQHITELLSQQQQSPLYRGGTTCSALGFEGCSSYCTPPYTSNSFVLFMFHRADIHLMKDHTSLHRTHPTHYEIRIFSLSDQVHGKLSYFGEILHLPYLHASSIFFFFLSAIQDIR